MGWGKIVKSVTKSVKKAVKSATKAAAKVTKPVVNVASLPIRAGGQIVKGKPALTVISGVAMGAAMDPYGLAASKVGQKVLQNPVANKLTAGYTGNYAVSASAARGMQKGKRLNKFQRKNIFGFVAKSAAIGGAVAVGGASAVAKNPLKTAAMLKEAGSGNITGMAKGLIGGQVPGQEYLDQANSYKGQLSGYSSEYQKYFGAKQGFLKDAQGNIIAPPGGQVPGQVASVDKKPSESPIGPAAALLLAAKILV